MESIIRRLKKFTRKEIDHKRLNNALQLVSAAARLLYETNQKYVDDELEGFIHEISTLIQPLNQTEFDNDTVLFYDDFALENRGLALIYLKALIRCKRVVYVTHKKMAEFIPKTRELLRTQEVVFLPGSDYMTDILELGRIISEYAVSSAFFYINPDDVVGAVIMNSFKGHRYLINLTDHAFWLGASAVDTCIEFRDYGASISKRYRGIDSLVKIPFYPVLDNQREFLGFPFDKGNRQVVFSGGALYKTFGGDNLYYKIVDYMLSSYTNIIFWYAGSGDASEINKLKSKYPSRVYLTEERPDLLAVLQHCLFYLSTYPISGGLMFQYAACAEKVPLTLKYDEDTEGYLLHQENLGITFDSVDKLKEEMDRLIVENGYAEKKGRVLRESVMTEAAFENEVKKLFSQDEFSYPIQFKSIDTTEFRRIYEERVGASLVNESLAQKRNMIVLKYFPIRYFLGAAAKVWKRLRER